MAASSQACSRKAASAVGGSWPRSTVAQPLGGWGWYWRGSQPLWHCHCTEVCFRPFPWILLNGLNSPRLISPFRPRKQWKQNFALSYYFDKWPELDNFWNQLVPVSTTDRKSLEKPSQKMADPSQKAVQKHQVCVQVGDAHSLPTTTESCTAWQQCPAGPHQDHKVPSWNISIWRIPTVFVLLQQSTETLPKSILSKVMWKMNLWKWLPSVHNRAIK